MPAWLLLFLLALPAAIAAGAVGLSPLVVFVLAALSLVPLAGLINEATEALAKQFGHRIGGLLNATFGNAAELIIGVIAIGEGLNDVVRASIAGSVIGNSLLVLGTALIAGGWRHRRQYFQARDAGHYAALLALAVVGLVIPTVTATYGGSLTGGTDIPAGYQIHELSNVVAGLLLLAYVAYIAHSVFGIRATPTEPTADPLVGAGPFPVEGEPPGVPPTTLDLDARARPTEVEPPDEAEPPTETQPSREPAERQGVATAPPDKVEPEPGDPFPAWVPAWLHIDASPTASMLWLAAVTVLTAVASDVLVGSIEPVAHEVGLSTFFIGLIVLPIVGNAGEHVSAITMALHNHVDATMAITAGSAIQVALFLAPVFVLISTYVGHPLNFVFVPLELVIFGLVAFLYALVSLDGESTWLEGLLLLVFYTIVAVAAYFVPH